MALNRLDSSLESYLERKLKPNKPQSENVKKLNKKAIPRLDRNKIEKLFTNGKLSFDLVYCRLCQGTYVKCPRCSQLSCKKTYGQGGNCPVCPSVYQLADSLQEATKDGI